MGEATYYAKMFFETEQKAIEAMPKIQEFFYEGQKAYEYWQDNRDMKDGEHFWKQLEFKFPMVAEYLKTIAYDQPDDLRGRIKIWGVDHNNGLSGLLDFGMGGDVTRNFHTSDNELRYSATVWHFADWDYLIKFVKNKFGAVRCTWISDEHIDPFDTI